MKYYKIRCNKGYYATTYYTGAINSANAREYFYIEAGNYITSITEVKKETYEKNKKSKRWFRYGDREFIASVKVNPHQPNLQS